MKTTDYTAQFPK